MEQQVQRSTFYLLWCENCRHAEPPPARFEAPDFVAPAKEALRCNGCGEPVYLIECFTAPQATMWHARPGASWVYVVYPETLPGRPGRQVWMAP